MILVILTETALFTIFVVAYLYYIGKSISGPYPHEVLELPILGTVMLLSSSGTIVLAEQNLHKGITGLFNLWWFITALLGMGFLIYTGVEWHKLIYEDHLTISTNLFGSTFYSLVGLHASHVVVGLILILMILIFNITGKIKPYHHQHIIMISWYWHFVDAVWVVVFTVVYLIGGNS
jgi:cytochrome c oxidase subunit 3